MLVAVVGLSIRFWRMGSSNGGWLRVVEILGVCLGSRVLMSPICGRSSMRALRSSYSGVWVMMRVFIFV